MSEYKLTQEIIQRSQSKIWDIARLEWTLNEISKQTNLKPACMTITCSI